MEELKTISRVFNFFTYVSVIVGVVCAVCSMFCFLGDNVDEGTILVTIGISGFISAGILKFSKILTDALDHIVTAARKYTNS